jgi:hypothetical protein
VWKDAKGEYESDNGVKLRAKNVATAARLHFLRVVLSIMMLYI